MVYIPLKIHMGPKNSPNWSPETHLPSTSLFWLQNVIFSRVLLAHAPPPHPPYAIPTKTSPRISPPPESPDSPGDSWKASNSREAEASPAYSLFFNVSPRGEQVGGPTADQKKTSWWPRAHGSPLILPIRLSVFDWKKNCWLSLWVVSPASMLAILQESWFVVCAHSSWFTLLSKNKVCLNGKLVNKNSLHEITKQTRSCLKKIPNNSESLPCNISFQTNPEDNI